MKLLNFQQKIISKGINHLSKGANEFIFQSPTGSGKTFISANFFEEIFLNSQNIFEWNSSTSILFFSPSKGNLAFQSYDKIDKYLLKSLVEGYSVFYHGFSETSKEKRISSSINGVNSFNDRTVHFFGWDSVIKKTNNFTSEFSERRTFWDVLENTINNNTNLVIFIDEIHENNIFGSAENKTKSFINKIINYYKDSHMNVKIPKIIGMSATVEHSNIKYDHKVSYDEVAETGIIKQNIDINLLNGEELSIKNKSENFNLINNAILQQRSVIKELRKNNSNITPLILIQLPNETKKDDINWKDIVNLIVNHKDEFDINEHEIGIWLQNKKINAFEDRISKSDIEDLNSNIKILIFKTAIAVGWDIPRANILVSIRKLNQNKSFKVQTIGRILRNPFKRIMNNYYLDTAFIYTFENEAEENIQQLTQKERKSKEVVVKNKWKNITFEIDRIEVKKEYVDVDKLLSFDEISNYLKSLNEDIKRNEMIDNDKIASNHLNLINSDDIGNIMKKTKLSANPKTLYEIYLIYRTSIKNKLILELFDQYLKQNIECENWIKKGYYYFIENKNIIVTALQKRITEKISKSNSVKYLIPKKIEIPENEIVSSPISEELLYYDYKYNYAPVKEDDGGSDSVMESKFYEKLINYHQSDIDWIIRNRTKNYSYSIEYINEHGIISKFFPDFIIKTEKNILVVDPKSDRIDSNAQHKFLSMKKLENDEYKYIFVEKNNNVFYEYSFDENNQKKWEKDFFKYRINSQSK